MTEHSFIKCEALKYAYRQTSKGVVISFLLHPNEVPKELATAPINTRVLLAVAEIIDEQSIASETAVERDAANLT